MSKVFLERVAAHHANGESLNPYFQGGCRSFNDPDFSLPMKRLIPHFSPLKNRKALRRDYTFYGATCYCRLF